MSPRRKVRPEWGWAAARARLAALMPSWLACCRVMCRCSALAGSAFGITGLGNVSGRSLAGVNPESYTQPNTRSSSYQYTTPLCDATAVRRPDGTTPSGDDEKLLYCTSQYYTAGTAAGTAIWADAKRAAPLLHNLIGVTVYNRAREQF